MRRSYSRSQTRASLQQLSNPHQKSTEVVSGNRDLNDCVLQYTNACVEGARDLYSSIMSRKTTQTAHSKEGTTSSR